MQTEEERANSRMQTVGEITAAALAIVGLFTLIHLLF